MSSATDPAHSASSGQLGALEQQVMDHLWDRAPLSVRQVIELLPADPAYTTIATVLANLERKGLVEHHRQGRSVQYTAVVTREEHTAGMMRRALGSSRDRHASILRFVDSMSQAEKDLLRGYLQSRSEGDRS